jgi:hypothetical protein
VNLPEQSSPSKQGPGRDGRRIILLAVVLLLSRLPLVPHPTPVHPDETAFISGIGFPADYPVHPPGYPLWVALGTLLHHAGLSPYGAFQVWSLAASVIAPVLFYLGLRWLVSAHAAWWLAAAFGVSPLLWFQSATALTFAAATTLGLVVVGLCFKALHSEDRSHPLWAVATLCIGVLLRGDMIIYLGPLCIWTIWRRRKHGGPGALTLLVIGCLAYAALTLFLYSRGEGASAASRFEHSREVIMGTSVFRLGLVHGLLRNAVKVAVNVAWDLGLASFLLPPACWILWRRRQRWPASATLLLWWLLPGVLFLLCMHVVQGYVLLLLPAAYVILGLAMEARFSPKVAARTAALIAALSAAQFLFYPWSVQSTGFKRRLDAKIAFQSAAGLRHIDQRALIHEQGDYWRTGAHQTGPAPGNGLP